MAVGDSLQDTFYERALTYSLVYVSRYEREKFVWYCVGAFNHQPVAASSRMDEFLDECRKSYSYYRERHSTDEATSGNTL